MEKNISSKAGKQGARGMGPKVYGYWGHGGPLTKTTWGRLLFSFQNNFLSMLVFNLNELDLPETIMPILLSHYEKKCPPHY